MKPLAFELNKNSHIKNIIGVMSGKGGVGKTMVTAQIATLLRQRGYAVGILDADITGPSIPKGFGLHDKVVTDGEEIHPLVTETGIRVMSLNLVLDDPSKPVLWRGPVLIGVLKQFFTDVHWGELDYLLVDMPPGTGDVALTVFQSFHLDGVIMVTTPQSLVEMIVEKAVHMARMMGIPILAFVENMAYFKCPGCGDIHEIYGPSQIKEMAERFGVSHYVSVPLDPKVARSFDAGETEKRLSPELAEIVEILEKGEKE